MGRHGEGRWVRKSSVGWQSPRAEAAVQRRRETDQPETKIKKQPQRKENRRWKPSSHLPQRPYPASPIQQPLVVRVGGDSQARATRTALWEEEAAPGWGLGLKCQVAGQVAMATETKTGTEERLGTGAPRRAPAAAGPWGSPGSLYWTGVEHQQELMGSQPFRRACRFSSIQVLGSACSGCQDLPCCSPALFSRWSPSAVPASRGQRAGVGGPQPTWL